MMITKGTKLISIDKHLNEAVQKAKRIYLEGKVFIYPTDTLYGFGANPFNEDAVKKINRIKRRKFGKMYILLINDIDSLLNYVEIKSENHIDFLLSIWPNPISVVLSLNSKTSKVWGIDTAAFRIPNQRFCLKLLNELKMPLISTSVNRSSKTPLIEPSFIEDEFSSEVEAIFYTEKKSYFEVSTLIDLSDNKPLLLREGKIKFDDLLEKFNEI